MSAIPMEPTCRSCDPRRLALLMMLVFCHAAATAAARGQESDSESVPQRYVLNYPPAAVFVTPTRTTFADAARVVVKPGVDQHPNGGYGKAMFEVAGRPMFHTGADLAWFQTGAPVYAVADGVVRISMPPHLDAAGEKNRGGVPTGWGNMIVIEHRLPEGGEFLTLYAHLDNDRRVHPGDVVCAGQLIGEIGKKSAKINGGYEPHLHFGVREGTLLPKGAILFSVLIEGRPTLVRLDQIVGEEAITVRVPEGTPDLWGVSLRGVPVDVQKTDGRYSMPAWILWDIIPPEAAMVGYSPGLDGWVDPLGLLRSRNAGEAKARRLEPTWHSRKEPLTNITGAQAPPWQVEEWLRPLPDEAGDVTDLEGPVVCLVCIQSSCRGSRSHALPAVVELAKHYGEDPQVQIVVLQTPFRNDRRNGRDNLERIAEALPESVAVGQCTAEKRSAAAIVDGYALRCTPWIVLIDADGRVRLSGVHIRSEACVTLIDALIAEVE